jgi:L-asparaginase
MSCSPPEITGIVVTHGTDTLEETVYFLDLTTVGVKPVLLVGAQRPASDPDSDGPRNLLDAVRVAIANDVAGKGVMVVMNGQISAARDVTSGVCRDLYRHVTKTWLICAFR